MKNYYKIIVSLAIVLVVGIIIFACITEYVMSNPSDDDADAIILNDISKLMEENHGDLSVLDDKNYDVHFVILDNLNKLIYDSSENGKGNTNSKKSSSEISGVGMTVEEAVNRHYPYMYLTQDEKVTGVVIILEDKSIQKYQSLRICMSIGFSVFVFIVFIVTVLFGMYIKRRIVIPFQNMREFAGDVAQGKLDTPLEMDRDNMFGAFTESFDIMREELAESREREIALQRREKELVASLSHDLKTPITGIKVTTELLNAKFSMKSGINEEDCSMVLEKLDNIYKKADQIDVLVSDLFASTLDDLGEFKVNCQDVEARILSDIVRKYDDKSLVRNSGEEDIPDILINTDPKRMSQVIGNIISNSYKYAGTEIDLSYKLIDDFLEMRISDHGPGVSKDELSLITNKFFRGKDWETSNEEGNGLGLYISKNLMEKMNGELIPESKGEGLTITLLIPLS